jgi:KDO2-lipid IV(A) lauroyltransferase
LAQIAAKSQAPVLPVFIHRRPDLGHRVTILPMLAPPANRAVETIHDATQRYTTIIEQAIRLHPEQWIWIHRRWRTQTSDIPIDRKHLFLLDATPPERSVDPIAY